MSDVTSLLLIGLVIGSNNLAAALAIGALGKRPRLANIVVIFGLFEFFIPLVGLWAGQRVSGSIAQTAGWIGPALIALLGLYTLACSGEDEAAHDRLARRLSRKRGLVLLAAGLSIDNLVVGFSVGLRGVSPLALAATIAAFSMTFTAIGVKVGDRLQRHHRCRTERATGVLLLLLAAALVFDFV